MKFKKDGTPDIPRKILIEPTKEIAHLINTIEQEIEKAYERGFEAGRLVGAGSLE